MSRSRDTADQINIIDSSAADATAITIDSSENVSIGHASPTAILDVRRGDASGKIAEFHTSTGFGVELGSSQSEAYVQAGSSQALLFNTNGSNERMRIDSSGNIGIGTSAPHDAGTNFNMLTLNGPKGGGVVFSDDDVNQHMINTTDDASLRFSRGANLDSESMRIDSSGHAIIPAGVTLGTAAGVHTAANTLDDYEEGTWNPQWSSTGYTYGYSEVAGLYTKVGRLVTLTGRIDVNSVSGSGSALASIVNLPFTSSSNAGSQASHTPMQQHWGSATARLMFYMGNSRNYLNVYDNAPNSNYVTLKGNQIGTSDSVIFSISYMTDS